MSRANAPIKISPPNPYTGWAVKIPPFWQKFTYGGPQKYPHPTPKCGGVFLRPTLKYDAFVKASRYVKKPQTYPPVKYLLMGKSDASRQEFYGPC